MASPAGNPPAPAGAGRSRPWLAQHAWVAVVPAAVLLCYLPVVFFDYGFSEDYRLLAAYDRGATLSRLMIAEGRPLFAVWARIVFGGLSDIGSLRVVRLFNVLLLGGLGVTFTLAWQRAKWERWESAMAGVALLTLPSFQLFAATAAMGAVAIAALFGAAAAFVARAGCDGGRRALALSHGIAAALLLLIGLATYQPAGLLYFAFAGIFLIAADTPRPEFNRMALAFAAVSGPALLAEFAVFLAGRRAFLPYLEGAPRADLVFDPLNKAAWFLMLPLPHALNLWKLYPNLVLALAMMIALPTVLGLYLRHRDAAATRAMVAFLLLPLCYLPNLAVVENRSSFRSLPALGALVLVYYLIALRSQFGPARRRIHYALLAGLLGAGMVSAVRTVTTLIAIPQARELAIVRDELARLPSPRNGISVIPSDFRDSLAPLVMYDEFGYPSTALPWSADALTYLVLRELHPASDTVDLRATSTRDGPADAIIVDWGRILRDATRLRVRTRS